jgi:ferrous iron transport protein A
MAGRRILCYRGLKVIFKISSFWRSKAVRVGGSLAALPRGSHAVVDALAGERPFRRRLMEMGLVPGRRVAVVNVAPLGDPIEIEVRSSRISIRRYEAALIAVRP